MPLEKGGRADKYGNRFEMRWVIYQLLKVLEEKIQSVEVESIGEEEEGVDLWVTFLNGNREAQQCKVRNASSETWDISSLKSKGILEKWRKHLERDPKYTVSLVSPLSFIFLTDLSNRAKNTNTNPSDFYNYQIKPADPKFQKFFESYCKEYSLNVSDDKDLHRAIDFLSRTNYHQPSDLQLFRDQVLDKIEYLFIDKRDLVYNTLVQFVVEEDIWGKPITNTLLRNFLSKENFSFRELASDPKVSSRIDELNFEYSQTFVPINGELISRIEIGQCIQAIKAEKSIVIHGSAGHGKSGCTEGIILYCKENNVPYVSIKLDKRIPGGSREAWGEKLGLPASVAHSIHAISKEENAVIIFDQLDALRWTQAHSSDALSVCTEIIREVSFLNLEREKKISLVLVCRTFDYENDNNIKSLFNKNGEKGNPVEWGEIQVGKLKDETVRTVVGEAYDIFSKKTKEVLSIPSNLYIWQKINKEKSCHNFSTANELIGKWWSQLLQKCMEIGLEQKHVMDAKDNIVNAMERYGVLCVHEKRLRKLVPKSLEFLASSGFIIRSENGVSFAHQSLLDYFLVEKMLDRYEDGEGILDIIGGSELQTPGRRYQIQMLLQNINEISPLDFINIGREMLESPSVRFYVKYVFLEVLSQCSNLDSSEKKFVLEYCENEKFENHIRENILLGRQNFIQLLLDNGVLDKWMKDEERKDNVFRLLGSLRYNSNNQLLDFIKKYAFVSKEMDGKLLNCFSFEVDEDSDEMFELRMEYYEKYPEWAESYIDLKKLFQSNEMRAVKYFEFLLKHELRRQENSIRRFTIEFWDENSEIVVNNFEDILSILLPYVPLETEYSIVMSDWSGRYRFNNEHLERTCIEIIKKANIALIKSSPELFFTKYKDFYKDGYLLFNEIVLAGLEKTPSSFSDDAIDLIISSFDTGIIDETSGTEDHLALAKAVLSKHSKHCNTTTFTKLEETIMNFVDSRASYWYKRRIDSNKNKEFSTKVYWAFWGEMQHHLLPCLDKSRISKKTKELIAVLERRFKNESTMYCHHNGTGGTITSSIYGKELNNRQWLEILSNKKLYESGRSRWTEVNGSYIENSLSTFSGSFQNAVSSEPDRFINLIMNVRHSIHEVYIDSLFDGVSQSDKLKSIDKELLEEMILKLNYNYSSQRAGVICRIIEKREEVNWSKEIIAVLKDIAVNHENPNAGQPIVTSKDDQNMSTFDMLRSNSINCVRGKAGECIATLLWQNKDLFVEFKETVSSLLTDVNPAVNLAGMSALYPTYDIDKEWATEKFLEVFERDFRYAADRGAKQIFFLLYPTYREQILSTILKCYLSEDKELITRGSYALAEMYICNGEFKKEIFDVKNMSEIQTKSILEMSLAYFNKEEKNEKVKSLIKMVLSSEADLEFPISRIFYDKLIDLERDSEFLVELMKTKVSKKLVYTFARYLEEEAKSVLDFKDIIISLCHSVIESKPEKDHYWGIEKELSKLIVGLYDETTRSSDPEVNIVSQQCLDIWDLMFEKQIGSVRTLSQQILDR